MLATQSLAAAPIAQKPLPDLAAPVADAAAELPDSADLAPARGILLGALLGLLSLGALTAVGWWLVVG